jgi:hypothetical protein
MIIIEIIYFSFIWFIFIIYYSTKYNLTKIIDQIDLDDPEWRRLFSFDLSKNPDLEIKVEQKKQEIERMKIDSKEILQNILSLDIIKYCIYPFF